jgi:hypothetical protein
MTQPDPRTLGYETLPEGLSQPPSPRVQEPWLNIGNRLLSLERDRPITLLNVGNWIMAPL